MSFQNSPPLSDGFESVDHCLPVTLESLQATYELPIEIVRNALLACDEQCDPSRVCYYPDIETMVAQQRQSKHWSQGEIFVFSRSKDHFIVAKQIAPSSCEFLFLTHDGYKDVLTAYRYEQDELVAILQGYLD